MVTGRLLATIAAAADHWGIRFDPLPGADRRDDGRTDLRGTAVEALVKQLRDESDRYAVD